MFAGNYTMDIERRDLGIWHSPSAVSGLTNRNGRKFEELHQFPVEFGEFEIRNQRLYTTDMVEIKSISDFSDFSFILG